MVFVGILEHYIDQFLNSLVALYSFPHILKLTTLCRMNWTLKANPKWAMLEIRQNFPTMRVGQALELPREVSLKFQEQFR